MDNDLIRRSALMEALENGRMVFKSTITVPEALLAQGEHWRRCLESAPAVDAVEVGNCDGCIWANRKRPQKCSCCRRNPDMKDCFYSYGERRDDVAER